MKTVCLRGYFTRMKDAIARAYVNRVKDAYFVPKSLYKIAKKSGGDVRVFENHTWYSEF